MRLAHIENGIVVNLSLSHEILPYTVNVDGVACNIGDSYIDGSFVARQQTLEDIRELRKVAYPPLTDLADALYWQQQGDSTKIKEYLHAVEQVKLQYPKPG